MFVKLLVWIALACALGDLRGPTHDIAVAEEMSLGELPSVELADVPDAIVFAPVALHPRARVVSVISVPEEPAPPSRDSGRVFRPPRVAIA